MKTRRTDPAGTHLHHYRQVSRQHYFLLKVGPSHVMMIRKADASVSWEHFKRAESAGLYIPISKLFDQGASAESRSAVERAAIGEVVKLAENQIASPHRAKGQASLAVLAEIMSLERGRPEDPRKK